MRKRINRKLMLIFKLLIILVVLLVVSTIFALVYSMNSNIINHISINNIDVAGLSRAEADAKFEEIMDNIIDDEISFCHGDYEKKFTLKTMELEANTTDKVYEACLIGRDKNIFINNYKIISVLLNGVNLDLDIKFNDEILESIFSNLDDEWEGKFTDNSYYIDNDKLVIVRGKTGTIIDKEKLKQELIKIVREKIESKNVATLEIPVIEKNPSEIDLEQIQKEIYKEAKDASYNEETEKLSIHADGIDFGVSMDEAKQIIAEEKEEYIIPLKITKPAVTTDMLGEEAFPDTLAKFSTRYDASNKNRATNIELASEAINRKGITSRRSIFI